MTLYLLILIQPTPRPQLRSKIVQMLPDRGIDERGKVVAEYGLKKQGDALAGPVMEAKGKISGKI